MKRSTVITLSLIGLMFYFFRSKYSIEVKPQGTTVDYTMQVGDKQITGSYTLGQPPQITDATDGEHWFVVFGNPATGIVSLAISTKSADGGYLAKKETLVSLT